MVERKKRLTEEEMADHLNFKGYEVHNALDLMAKAEALGFEYLEASDRWVETRGDKKA